MPTTNNKPSDLAELAKQVDTNTAAQGKTGLLRRYFDAVHILREDKMYPWTKVQKWMAENGGPKSTAQSWSKMYKDVQKAYPSNLPKPVEPPKPKAKTNNKANPPAATEPDASAISVDPISGTLIVGSNQTANPNRPGRPLVPSLPGLE